MQFAEVTIIAPTAVYVKSEVSAPHVRVMHESIAVKDIELTIRSRGRHVARCAKKRRSVRVPAMRGREWGQFLRTLELTRALA
ncbi:hypothetical protein [Erwinia amylovora]|uniref:hypothetical protein n=1 Tax=Erwinia amylovora TaxID=552 RepID=UPI000C089376|nr:hypothetical protein [Erwinia amylovora]